MINAWSYRFPKNTDSLLFTPAGHSDWFEDFILGEYESSSRELQLYTDEYYLEKIYHLSDRQTKPANPIKTALQPYSLYGSKSYSELSDGKWKDIGNSISVTQARSQWDYILANQGANGLAYGVLTRSKEVVSPYAEDYGERELSDSEVEDIYKGYLALLINTWRLVPDGM